MKIDLSTIDREVIVTALKVAQNYDINRVDWNGEREVKSAEEEKEIRTNYLRLIKLISLGK